ncbi:hypothetical protein HK104_003972 [Borealophlyctis nickersoniae]|nr:hypothetical protein HK104_003972 [Borealophlyctis nickersoniae]
MSSQLPIAIVIGATRGIGRATAIALAEHYHVVVSGRTTTPTTSTPDTIHTVAAEITALGRKATPIVCNVRSLESITSLLQESSQLGRIEVMVYNAGAIYWGKVMDTDDKRFELLQEVNIRGCYTAVRGCVARFKEQGGKGRIVVVSPPIYSRFFRGKTAYAIGKVGMTVLTHGLAMELSESPSTSDISITAIWPATAVQSAVTDVHSIAPHLLRKPSIFGDAIVRLALEKDAKKISGRAVVDEDYLREVGVKEFEKYRVDPAKEPPRMLPKKFPSLLVEEQDDRGWTLNSSAIKKTPKTKL